MTFPRSARTAALPAFLLSALLCLSLGAGSPARAQTDAADGTRKQQPPKFLVDRLSAGGSFGWFSSDSLRFLSEIQFDFPWFVVREKGLYARGRLRSSISRIEDDFTFRVEDVDYAFETGVRDYLSPRVAIAAYVAQQGSENLDQSGSAWVRHIGFGAQTATFPRPGRDSRLDWNFELGGVFKEEGIDGDFVVRGDILWDAIRFDRSTLGADVSLDSLVTSGDWRSDWRVGPRWSFDLSNGIRASLFARWIRSRNPLGVGVSGLHVGLQYAEGAYRGGTERRLPDVRGTLSLGAGADRNPARFDLEALMPPFRLFDREGRVFVDVDAQTLTGRGSDNLFYTLSAGSELGLVGEVVAGGYLVHRSYHQLAEGLGEIRDINTIESGLRSRGWDYDDREPGLLAGASAPGWPGSLEWTLRAAYISRSSYPVERSGWLARTGVRWDLPAPAPGYTPFVLAEGDFGELSRSRTALGITLPVDMAVSGEYRRDKQLRGDDKTEIALLLSLYY